MLQQEQLLIEAIIKAFARLSFSRPVGMSLGTISLSDIIGYWQHIEKLIDQLDDWIDMIQSLDSIFIDFHAQKKSK